MFTALLISYIMRFEGISFADVCWILAKEQKHISNASERKVPNRYVKRPVMVDQPARSQVKRLKEQLPPCSLFLAPTNLTNAN